MVYEREASLICLPLGKICATLDGVRRLQRLGYREGLYLCRAIRRGNILSLVLSRRPARDPLSELA